MNRLDKSALALPLPKGCTGYAFDENTIHHDAGSCPIHEPEAFAEEQSAITEGHCRVDGAIVTFEEAHRLLDECVPNGFVEVECSHARCPRGCPNWLPPEDSENTPP